MEGRRLGTSAQLFCVNCNLSLENLRGLRVLSLDTRASSVLCSWVYPKIITEEDHVCEACWNLALAEAKQNLPVSDQQAGPSQCSNYSTCILCGLSASHGQSDVIIRDNPTKLQRKMRMIIESIVTPRQITATDRVCRACWVWTQREARRSVIDAGRLSMESLHHEVENLEITQQESPKVPSSRSVDMEVTLPNYKRAADTGDRCVFPECGSTQLHSINDLFRATVLGNHNYYLPKCVRICSEHVRSNCWDLLYEAEQSISTFSTDHVQHIFSFVNAFKPTPRF